MPKWTSYSYINLAARGVDCLSYLAVARFKLGWSVELTKQTISGQTVWNKFTSFSCQLWLAPIAEIRPNVFISGVRLLSGGVGPSGVSSNRILSPIDISTLNNAAEYQGLYKITTMTTSNNGRSVPFYAGNSYRTTSDLRGRTILRQFYSVGDGVGVAALFDWDDVHNIATATASFNAGDIASALGTIFASDFSGQSLSLDSSYTYTRTFSMQCPYPESAAYIKYEHSAVDDYGAPWSEPLFTFPFV